jgi:rfaE bifunctional protein nucleotidyltransferase chain/domain
MSGFDYRNRVFSRADLRAEIGRRQAAGEKVVFTNGSFDLLHLGHLDYLTFARAQGDCLVVGLNSDESVRRYKGPTRPILPQAERAALLSGLRAVDYVVIFDEDEPKELIAELRPDVLVKGADWAHYVSGRESVEANGGRVVLANLVPGRSTSSIVEKIRATGSPGA